MKNRMVWTSGRQEHIINTYINVNVRKPEEKWLFGYFKDRGKY
jgi:hypothetical protein